MRRQPTWNTLRALFARSSNCCGFPDCLQELVTEDHLFVGQVCHIRAAEAGGARFDSSQTEEERRSPENLLLLCYPHHVRVDAPNSGYSVEQLADMKNAHEQRAGSPYQPSDDILRTLGSDLDAYWQRVSASNTKLHAEGIPAAQFDRLARPLDLLKRIDSLIRRLQNVRNRTGPEAAIHPDDVENYLVPNTYIYLWLTSAQLRVRLLEVELKDNPTVEAVARLSAAQNALEQIVASSILND